jgi:membrane protein YqaA with SNARE-associated domain
MVSRRLGHDDGQGAQSVRSFLYAFLGYFLTPAGLIVLAALDSSLVFFLPLGIDFVIVVLAARTPDLFWLYPLLSTVGSLIGGAGTFWIGRKVGEPGLARLMKPARLQQVQARVRRSAGISVAVLAVIPPPFPFTAFLLTSGALRVDPWRFFITLGTVRLLRFGAESGLAVRYGRGILVWMESPAFELVVAGLTVMAFAGTAVSAVAVIRGTEAQR